MKKSLSIIAVCLLIAICVFGLVACDKDGDKPHTHTYVKHAAVTATCGTDGSIEYWSCSGCEDLFADDKGTLLTASVVVKATNEHAFGEWSIIKEPTCNLVGEKERVCSVCAKKETAEVDIIDIHTFGEWTVTKEPTCVETGEKERVCSVCAKKEKSEIKATRHSFGEWSSDNTHHWQNCANCNEIQKKAAHEWENSICMTCFEVELTEGLSYTLNSDNASYTLSGIGSAQAVNIKVPSTYEGLPVTHIGDDAFNYNEAICSVILPDSIISIGNSAFETCLALTSFKMGKGVVTIGEDAFGSCEALVSLELPDSVTTIGAAAFVGCESLISINIPYGVTILNEYVFEGCWALESIVIPDSVTTIDNFAFDMCKSLDNIVIPNSVTTLGNIVFSNCESLKSITLPESITEIKYMTFSMCKSLETIVIPSSVTSIGDGAFRLCTNLKNITIPDNVTSIGSSFTGCSELTSIVIGKGVASIDEKAFEGCVSLNEVFYRGTIEEWGNITIGNNNVPLINATMYFYSEAKPSEEGNFWYFKDGAVTKW